LHRDRPEHPRNDAAAAVRPAILRRHGLAAVRPRPEVRPGQRTDRLRTAAAVTTLAAAQPRRLTVPRVPNWALGTAGVVTLIIVLEVLPRAGILDPRYLPPFSEIISTLVTNASTGAFWTALGHTVLTWGIGLGIALFAGILLGVIIGSSPFLREFTSSTVE